MSGPMFGVGAGANLRAQYEEQLRQLENADWLQLQVPHGAGGEPGVVDEYGAPWYPREYVPPDMAAWGGDPGIYAEPDPSWPGDPGIYVQPTEDWGGDPGIVAGPPPVVEPQPRGRVLAPSIVPGLDWATGGPYREVGPNASEQPDAPDATDSMSAMDHVLSGANGFWLPSLVGGALSGIFAASAVRGTGGGLAAFGNRFIGSVLVGGLTGAGAGLLVAATSPGEGDSLTARYAVAGGLVGAATGAAFPMGPSRIVGAVGGAISGAIIAGFTGNELDKRRS